MHVNLTETSLTREELFFMGMAMQYSKAIIGIHLSLNEMSYYDRVFLRILINAKARGYFKNMAEREQFITQ